MKKINLTSDQKTIAALGAILGVTLYRLAKIRREQALATGYIEGVKIMLNAQNGNTAIEGKAE